MQLLYRAQVLLCLFVGSTAWRVCNVKSMGASGDGKTDDTAVLRKALAACDEVVLSAPGRYLTGPLNLTSNQVLVISPNATLLATTNFTAFPVIAPLPSYGACGTRGGSVDTYGVGHVRHPCRLES
jgi:polygalacturonase